MSITSNKYLSDLSTLTANGVQELGQLAATMQLPPSNSPPPPTAQHPGAALPRRQLPPSFTPMVDEGGKQARAGPTMEDVYMSVNGAQEKAEAALKPELHVIK